MRGARILVVDDYPAMSKLLEKILTTAGYRATAFDDPRHALAAFKADAFDLVINDLLMPHMDGFQLMREMRAVRPVPGIALSGSGEPVDLAASRDAGYCLHLSKPINMDVLIQSVGELLRAHDH